MDGSISAEIIPRCLRQVVGRRGVGAGPGVGAGRAGLRSLAALAPPSLDLVLNCRVEQVFGPSATPLSRPDWPGVLSHGLSRLEASSGGPSPLGGASPSVPRPCRSCKGRPAAIMIATVRRDTTAVGVARETGSSSPTGPGPTRRTLRPGDHRRRLGVDNWVPSYGYEGANLPSPTAHHRDLSAPRLPPKTLLTDDCQRQRPQAGIECFPRSAPSDDEH